MNLCIFSPVIFTNRSPQWYFELLVVAFFVLHAECALIPVTIGLLKAKFIWAVLESYHESRDTLENFNRAKSK